MLKMGHPIDSGLSCFLVVLKFMGIPVTNEQVEDLVALKSSEKVNELHIIEAAKKCKLKAKLYSLTADKLGTVTSPLIAKDKNGEFFIIARSKDDKYMIFTPSENKTEVITSTELNELWEGTAILIKQKGIVDREAVFSFKWFIPTILKFKKEFIQVLIAVFVVQILGILTPVMTQVVVDKVLVHRSMSTLNVLAIGIAIVYIYELVLGMAKTMYLHIRQTESM